MQLVAPRLRALVIVALATAPACTSEARTREASAQRTSAAEQPWTATFVEPAVLFAATVEITGPLGLRQHVAVRQDSLRHEHSEVTTAQGYRIAQRQRPDSDGEPIKAHLDALEIHADVELVIFERVDVDEVTVHARGDVYYHVLKSGEERRVPSLRLSGAP
jgi:hypothetical protein